MEDLIKGELDWHNKINENFHEVDSQMADIPNQNYITEKIKILKNDLTINVPEDYSDIQSALDSLKQIIIPRDITVTISTNGKLTSSVPIFINHVNGDKIKIIGRNIYNQTITSLGTISGSGGNYSVQLNVDSTTNIEIGDYVILKNLVGTNDYYMHYGIWKVTAINSSTQVTILNTCQYPSFPTSTITSGTLTVLKTVLTFTSCHGIIVASAKSLGYLSNLAVIGDRGGIQQYGILTGYSSNGNTANGNIYLGSNVGVSGFSGSGIWSGYGSYVYCCGNVCSCNNGQHGYESDVGGNISTGWDEPSIPVANGNGMHGFSSNYGGHVWGGPNIIACGNVYTGICADTGSSFRSSDNGICNYNKFDGIKATNGSSIEINNNWTCNHNGEMGAYATKNSSISVGNDCICNNNTNDGINSRINSSISLGNNCICNNNAGNGFYSLLGGVIQTENSSTACQANNNGQYGLKAANNGIISLPSVVATNNASSLSNYQYYAALMSLISIEGSTGTTNITANTLSADGSYIKI